MSARASVTGDGPGWASAVHLLLCCVSVLAACGCEGPGDPEVFDAEQMYMQTHARWSPDGSSIVFRGRSAGGAGIYIADTSGFHQRLLVAIDGTGMTWSPDGRWIAFSAGGSLYRVNRGGDSLLPVGSGLGGLRPAWSPGGSLLAFVLSGVWVAEIPSGRAEQVLPSANFPAWFPDGRRLLALTSVDLPGLVEREYVLVSFDVGSGDAVPVATFRSAPVWSYLAPDPRGGTILVVQLAAGDDPQIWSLELPARRLRRLTPDGGTFPSWSPDGRRIVYTRARWDDGTLWVMNQDGSGRRRLTNSPFPRAPSLESESAPR